MSLSAEGIRLVRQVAATVRERRKALGLTQPQAAERARVSKSTWYHLELGDRDVTLRTLARAAAALDCTVGVLLEAPIPGAALPTDNDWSNYAHP